MKKSLLSFVGAMMLTLVLQAQDQPFYITGYAGIGMNLSPDPFRLLNNSQSTYIYETDTTTYSESFTLVDRSGGKAPRFGMAIGVRLSKEIPGLTFQVGILKQGNSKHEYETTYKDVIETYTDFYITRKHNITMTAKAFYINPALILQLQKGNWRPYMKMGLLVMFASLDQFDDVRLSTNYPNYIPTSSGTERFEFEIKPALGADFAFGTTYPLGDGFSVMGEIDFQYIRVAPTKVILTEYTENRKSLINNLTIAEKEVEFVEEYSTTYNPSPNQPSKALKEYFTFNALSVQAGFVYQF